MSLMLKNASAPLIESEYSTVDISDTLINDITQALKSVDAFGSVEIYIQDSKVTQITTRKIKKTNGFARKPQDS